MRKIRMRMIDYPEDVKVLRKALADAGWDASDSEVQELYHYWSEYFWCAAWMSLNDDNVKSFVRWIDDNSERDDDEPQGPEGD